MKIDLHLLSGVLILASCVYYQALLIKPNSNATTAITNKT